MRFRLPVAPNPGFGWPALVACLLFSLVVVQPCLLNDSDSFWHVAAGQWMLTHHRVPTTDPFSWTMQGRPWFAHEWLAELLMALCYRAAGWAGVAVLCAACCALAGWLMARFLLRSLPAPLAGLLLVLAGCSLSGSLLARPHLIALPVLIGWCAALVLARDRDSAPPWRVLPLMLVWANLHGGFMLGLAFASAMAVDVLLRPGRARFDAWLGFCAAAAAMACLNPQGLQGFLFPFMLLRMRSLAGIREWQPMDLHQPHPIELFWLLILYLVVVRRLRVPPFRLLLIAGLALSALHSARNEMVAGVLSALLLAEPLSRLVRLPVSPLLAHRWQMAGRLAVLGCGLAVALRLATAPSYARSDLGAALPRLKADVVAGKVLNSYPLGGYLIFHGVQPFVDGRADMYGDAFLDRYGTLMNADDGALRTRLERGDIGWTMFEPTDSVVRVMDRLPGWRRAYDDGRVVVHVRGAG